MNAFLPSARLSVSLAWRWLGVILLLSSIHRPTSIRAETTVNSGATEITTMPYTISTPGTYFLKRDWSIPSGNGIVVNASGVTIDLNGHTLTSATLGQANGIYAQDRASITVRNGTIANCQLEPVMNLR